MKSTLYLRLFRRSNTISRVNSLTQFPYVILFYWFLCSENNYVQTKTIADGISMNITSPGVNS